MKKKLFTLLLTGVMAGSLLASNLAMADTLPAMPAAAVSAADETVTAEAEDETDAIWTASATVQQEETENASTAGSSSAEDVLIAQTVQVNGNSSESTADSASVITASDDGVASAAEYSGSGTEDDPYLISSADDLQTLATEVLDKTVHAGEYFKLTADLTLPSGWAGIGGTSTTYSFQGVFDGDGHTITFAAESTSGTYFGLFNYIGKSASVMATVKNLTVDGSITCATRYVGGIAAYGYCNFENCFSNVTITNTYASSSSVAVTGGIIGYQYSTGGTITGCANYGTITSSTRYTGGIAGYSRGTIENCLNTGAITNTYSYSATSTSYYPCAGGIAGYSYAAADAVSSCVNTGAVAIDSDEGYDNANARISGISAYWTKDEYVTYCVTTYDLTSNDTTHTNEEGTGVTYTQTLTLGNMWYLNAKDGSTDNSYFWSLDAEDSSPVFADSANPAAVRVLYRLADGTSSVVYTYQGTTAAAPEGYESAAFADFTPGETVVTEDITVIEVKTVTLKLYMSTDGDELYTSYEATTGTAFTLPEQGNPTIEYMQFVCWVDADGNTVEEGDLLYTDTLYATWLPALDEDGTTYLLSTLETLQWFIEQVNSGNTDISGKLVADIYAYETDWTMLGSSSSYAYAGTFDGNGYAVTINTSSSSAAAVAFAGYLSASGTIQNLTIKGKVSSTNTKAYAGGVAVYNYGTITNCVNKANVTGEYAGGIVSLNYGTISNCGNEGSIYATYSGTCHAGGIAAQFAAPTSTTKIDRYIQNCYNWGDVSAVSTATTSTAKAIAGGLVGIAQYTTSSTYAAYGHYLANSYSGGALTAEVPSELAYAGGLIGYVDGSSSTVTYTYIEDCYYLAQTADAAYTAAVDGLVKTAENISTFTSDGYSSLLETLNGKVTTENGWTTWVADTCYDSKPAFRVSTPVYYTITYIGDYTATVTVEEGDTPVVCEDEDFYYTFRTDSAEGEEFAATEQFYADRTLYVTKNYYTYTLTYDAGLADEGSSVPEAQVYNSGTTVAVDFTTVPVRDGYTFTGWEDADGNFYSSDGTSSLVIRKDITLTAVFAAYDFAGSGTQEDPYQIDSVEALQMMAKYVTLNDTDFSEGKYYKQTADIDLSDAAWTPIGQTATLSSSADGNFTNCEYDGDGHKITGLTYTGGESDMAVGLFAVISGSTIKDLTVEGSAITNTYNGNMACTGSIAGAMFDSVLEGCSANINIVYSGGGTNTAYAGGLAGYVANGYAGSGSEVSDCSFEGTVTSSSAAGGILGYVYQSVGAEMLIDHVSADADVTASTESSRASAGGIAGGIVGSASSSQCTISNAGHQGKVTASSEGYEYIYAGGIAGYTSGTGNAVDIVNSYHGTGAISASGMYAGGIIAYINASGSSVVNCYSAAESVTAGTDGYEPGGIAGAISDTAQPTLTNGYYVYVEGVVDTGLGQSSETDTSGLQAIETAAALTETLNTWVSSNTSSDTAYESWYVLEDINSGYPVFAYQAADVISSMIDEIGEVTLDSGDAITAARTAYDALSDAAKAYVDADTLAVLEAAESTYAELVAADQAAQEEAAAVEGLIAAIGEVTLGSEDAITAAREAYDALSEAAKAYVDEDTLAVLEAAESTYAELAAAAVDELINAIGTVTLDSGDAITAAREAYDALSDAAKAYVTGLDTLTTAETTYAELVAADTQAQADAAQADALIAAIGTVTLDSEEAITAAREAYDALSDAAKAYVTGLETLTTAETTYAELVAADTQAQEDAAAVNALIAAIGEVTLESSEAIEAARAAYDALSDAAKAYVDAETLAVLEAAESTYAELVAADTQAQADAAAVNALIAAIGEVTLESSEAIEAARAAYDALSDAAKAYVDAETLAVLEAAESTYAELVAADEAAQAEAAAAAAAAAEAAAAEELIAAIGEVTLESSEAIEAARAAYDALSDAAKAYVDADTLAVLEAAESTYTELVAAAAEAAAAEVVVGTPAIKTVKNVKAGVKLTWKAAKNAVSYKVYRKTGSGKYKLIATLDASAARSYTDKTAKNGKTYYYKITAVGSDKATADSANKKIVRLKKASIKKLKNVAGRKVQVTVKKNAKATGYQIVYSTKKNFSKKKVVTVKNKKQAKAVIKKLKKNTKYYVKVRSYKKAGSVKYYSAWSKVKSVKVKK